MGFVTASTAMARKMGYKTPKFCKIVDWRLTMTNLALQVVITFYVLYALIRGKTYLQTEVPIGKVTNWGNGNDVFSAVQVASKAANTNSVTTVTQGTESVETTVLGCNNVGSGTLSDYEFDYDGYAAETQVDILAGDFPNERIARIRGRFETEWGPQSVDTEVRYEVW